MSILSKMMRIAGRDPLGNAKAISVDENGNLNTRLTGSISTKAENTRSPYPANPPFQTTNSYSRRVKWMDNDGTFWGTQGNNIQKSTDSGITWSNVLSIDTTTFGDIYDWMLMVADNGRITLGTMTGKVLTTNENQTLYNQSFAFLKGVAVSQFGHCAYHNILLVGAYAQTAVGDNACKEVYLSTDYGATWNEIFAIHAQVVNNAQNYHIHDVEYDPYSKRIWVSIGDGENSNLHYSDDMGNTWCKIFEDSSHKNNLKPTQIIAYPHGVVFGSDTIYAGLHYWKRSMKNTRPKVFPNDIERDFYRFKDSPELSVNIFAARRFKKTDESTTLLPFRRDGIGGKSSLLITEDGIKWFEIWRDYTDNAGLTSIAGFNGDVVLGLYREGANLRQFEIKKPIFKHV